MAEPGLEQFGRDLLLVQRLASGGMAEVFRARQTGIGGFEKTVAVKRILPHYAADPHFKEMFQTEVNLSARFQHPNIAQVFNCGEHDGYLFLVMEYVDGQNVSSLLRTAQKRKMELPPQLAAFFISEAAKGLHYAHSFSDQGRQLNVIHRDVSPQNIMVTYDGQVKLVDFGIAKAADQAEMTEPGKIKGKVAYMSPEQISGQPLDRRTDIFSLGIVLWESLTQRRLFKADGPTATMARIAQGNVPPPSALRAEVSGELDEITLRALSYSREKRYGEALDLHRDLVRHLSSAFPTLINADLAEFVRRVFAEEIADQQRLIGSLSADLPTITPKSGTHEPRARANNAGRGGSGVLSSPGVTIEQQRITGSHAFTGYQSSPPTRNWTPIWMLCAAALLVFAVILFWKPELKAVSPAAVPALVAWYQADAIGSEDGRLVSDWPDRAPGATAGLGQLIESSRPKLVTNAINGYPVVRFDGQDDFLQNDVIAERFRNSVGFTVIYVAAGSGQRTEYVLAMVATDKVRDIFKAGYRAGGQIRAKATTTHGPPYLDTDPGVALGFRVHTLQYEAPRLKLFVNGVEVGSAHHAIPEFFDAAHFTVGQEFDGEEMTDFLRGDVAEIIMFSAAVEEKQRAGLEKFLMNKYAIQGQ